MHKIKKFANNLISPGGTLSQRVVKSGFWVFFIRIFKRVFSLLRLIILARILSPNDFGLMGIAFLTMSILDTFSKTGFQQALIQKKEDIESYLNSVWTVLILRGFILFIILYFIAPYAAIFFSAPEAKPIIRVIGFSILFQAFTNIGITYFRKELEYNKEFIYQFTGTLADFIVAISAVFILRNVWALVLGILAGNIVKCLMSYLIHPYRPRLNFNLEKIKELFGFGKWVLGSGIVIFFATQGDDILLGKVLGATALGFYQMAFRFSNLMATEISHLISRVTFPAYSKLQDKIPKLREGFLRTVETTASLSLPLTAGIFILAPDFVRIFLGEKWMPMVLALRILSISGLMRSIAATGGPLFRAAGRPNIPFWINLMRAIVIVISIYPLTVRYGIEGTAISVLLSITFTMPFRWKASSKIIQYSNKRLVIRLLPSIVGTGLMAIVLWVIQSAFGRMDFVEFVGLVIIALISYMACQIFFWRFYGLGLIKTLQTLRRTV